LTPLCTPLTQLAFETSSFEVVICVFGIFFVPDMELALTELKRVLRTEGKLAIRTWGAEIPANTVFWNSVRNVLPDLYKGFNPWDRISEVKDVRSFLMAVSFEELDVVA
jgi:ubiquinone/menaquinone biosynthesis C-methylase UbiE